MHEKIVFSGSGGQGIQIGSRIFCQACMEQGFQVSLIPSYGAEMRGGNTTCEMVVSDSEIPSPLFDKADIVMILSNLAFKSFKDKFDNNGIYVIDNSIDITSIADNKLNIKQIKAVSIADEVLKNMKIVNMIALGAFIKATGILELDSAKKAIKIVFENKKSELIDLNIKALVSGYEQGVL